MYTNGKKRFSGLLLSLLFTAAAFLPALFPSRAVYAASVSLNKVQTSVYIGATVSLHPTSGTASDWKSSKPSVASVDSSGLVTGKKKGTATISCKAGGKTLKCTMNVRRRKRSRYISNAYAKVWLNIIGAVESGGMVYGHRDYGCFANPFENTPNEVSCTGGAYQEYGENLRYLLRDIKKQYPVSFKARDNAGIAGDIKTSWLSSPYQVTASSAKGKAIRAIISCNAGAFVQDLRAIESLDESITSIKALGITNLRCLMFMAECEHLGGFSSVKRVVLRAGNKNNLNSLKASLYKDQNDTSSSYQIGDKFFVSRHEAILSWLKQYIPANAAIL